MNKKNLIVLISILAVFITGIASGIFIMNFMGTSISTGVVLKSDNGTCFLVSHNSPIRLCDYSEKGNQFEKYTDGDKILVIHDGVAESYPASTLPLFTLKISDGSIEDVPENVISSLTELGWLTDDTSESHLTFTDEPVFIGDENANFSICVPEGWSYETSESSKFSENKYFGISIFRSDSPESTITVEFTEGFGVCGTGLRTEETTIGGYKAHKGIYDGNASFSYILFEDTPGFYVIQNNTDSLWWAEHKDAALEILDTIKIAEGIIFHDAALKIAQEKAAGEYKKQYSEYSYTDGTWTFTFETDKTAQSITVDKDGNILYNAKT